MLRRMLVLLIALTAFAVPFAVPEASADPVAPGIPECPDPVVDPATGEEYYPPTGDTVCASDDTENPIRPHYRVCYNDEVIFGAGGGQLVCARTFDWSYLPGPGVCAYHGEDGFNGTPTVCVNGPANGWDGCFTSVMAINVLCE